MGIFTVGMLAIGVALSAVSGVICYSGAGSVGALEWFPYSSMLLAHPTAALLVGSLMTLLGAINQTSRFD